MGSASIRLTENSSDQRLGLGFNRWAIAARAGFLIEASSYYRVVADALERAEHAIYIVGWEFDPQTILVKSRSETVAKLLMRLTQRGVQTYILNWLAPPWMAFRKQILSLFELSWRSPAGIHFKFDTYHPLFASHHDKYVVIDDCLAFCGGVDITTGRWDTRAHLPILWQRVDPSGESYPPSHDVHAWFEGRPAKLLADDFRDRWKRITGISLPPVESRKLPKKRWTGLMASHVPIGVARTKPSFQWSEPIREIESGIEAIIHGARQYIYLEQQYFSSARLIEALGRSLRRQEGPVILLVVSRKFDSKLENLTFGRWCREAAGYLRSVDHAGRFGAFTPCIRYDGDRVPVKVHSKLVIADDEMAIVGSANLSARSMGLDTESSILVDGRQSPEVRRLCRRLVSSLVAEHSGRRFEEILSVFQTQAAGRVPHVISGPGPRFLEPIRSDTGHRPGALRLSIIDPLRPTRFEMLTEIFLPERHRGEWHVFKTIGLTILGLAGISFSASAEWRALWLACFLTMAGYHGLIIALIVGTFFNPLIAGGAALTGMFSVLVGSYSLGRLTLPNHDLYFRKSRLAKVSNLWMGVLGVLVPPSRASWIAGKLRLKATAFFYGSLIGLIPIAFIGGIFSLLIRMMRISALFAISTSTVLALVLLWIWLRLYARFSKLGADKKSALIFNQQG